MNNELAQYVNSAFRNDEGEKDFTLKLDANVNQLNVPERNLTSPMPQKHHSLSSYKPLPVLNKKNQSAKDPRCLPPPDRPLSLLPSWIDLHMRRRLLPRLGQQDHTRTRDRHHSGGAQRNRRLNDGARIAVLHADLQSDEELLHRWRFSGWLLSGRNHPRSVHLAVCAIQKVQSESGAKERKFCQKLLIAGFRIQSFNQLLIQLLIIYEREARH